VIALRATPSLTMNVLRKLLAHANNISPFEINANNAGVSLINKKWRKKALTNDSFDSLAKI
jgi:hypothetical protein